MLQKTRRLFGSDTFFYATLALLGVEALWIALTGQYPMAYDEDFHLGIIQLYAQHLSPVWSGPVNIDGLGAVWRDPSYMYHYLMSFPYRLLALLVHDMTLKIEALRILNIGFMVAGMYVYRRVLLHTRASRGLVNVVFALLVLTPTIPFLAAQINYDNLLFLLVAVSLLLTMRLVREVRAGQISVTRWLLAVALYLISSLVMYSYLPVFAVLALWLAFEVVRAYGWRNLAALCKQWWRSLRQVRLIWRVGLALMIVVAGGLFVERYGVNVVNYGSPLPDCAQVLSVDECMTYAPWRRNHEIYQDKIAGNLPQVNTNPFVFTVDNWLVPMLYQLFYTLDGLNGNFAVGQPLPLPQYLSIGIGVIGLPLLLWRGRWILRQPWMTGLLVVAGAYLLALWVRNYSDFLNLHEVVAIQARYLVQILPILYFAVALAFANAMGKAWRAKTALASLAIAVLLLQGGGAMVYILRSNDNWYWPSQTVRDVNANVRNVLKKFVVGA